MGSKSPKLKKTSLKLTKESQKSKIRALKSRGLVLMLVEKNCRSPKVD